MWKLFGFLFFFFLREVAKEVASFSRFFLLFLNEEAGVRLPAMRGRGVEQALKTGQMKGLFGWLALPFPLFWLLPPLFEAGKSNAEKRRKGEVIELWKRCNQFGKGKVRSFLLPVLSQNSMWTAVESMVFSSFFLHVKDNHWRRHGTAPHTNELFFVGL